jgi:hypothetical protein
LKEFKSKDFLLTEEEIFEIKSKKNQVSQISYAVLFKIFQHYKRFPYKNDNTLEKISDIIKKQLEIKKNTKIDILDVNLDANDLYIEIRVHNRKKSLTLHALKLE